MKVFAVLALAFAAVNGFVIPATTLVRAPSHDSAVIQSDRLGGNFAYSVNQAHAYAAVSPIVKTVATPVGVSYSTPYAYAPTAYPASPFAYAAPYGYPSYPQFASYVPATVADDKKETTPVEFKTLPFAGYPYGYPYSPVASFVPATVADEKKGATTFDFNTLPYAGYPGYGLNYGYGSPFVTFKAAEKSE